MTTVSHVIWGMSIKMSFIETGDGRGTIQPGWHQNMIGG